MLTHTVLWVMISRRKICHLDILWKTYALLLIKIVKIYCKHLSTVIWFDVSSINWKIAKITVAKVNQSTWSKRMCVYVMLCASWLGSTCCRHNFAAVNAPTIIQKEHYQYYVAERIGRNIHVYLLILNIWALDIAQRQRIYLM